MIAGFQIGHCKFKSVWGFLGGGGLADFWDHYFQWETNLRAAVFKDNGTKLA